MLKLFSNPFKKPSPTKDSIETEIYSRLEIIKQSTSKEIPSTTHSYYDTLREIGASNHLKIKSGL